MYASGGEFTENIDKMGGEGTAEFLTVRYRSTTDDAVMH